MRFLTRSWRSRHPTSREGERRVIVFGAGDAGRRLLRSMGEKVSGFFPVALLDDDKSKQRLRIDGVRVLCTRKDIDHVAQTLAASALVIALPLAHAEIIRGLTDRH